MKDSLSSFDSKMNNYSFNDKDQEISYLLKLLDAYEKVTNLSNEELVEAYKTISAQETVSRLAREELIRATEALHELRGRENKISQEIVRILDEDQSNEEIILQKLDTLSQNTSSGFFSDLFFVLANLEIAEEEAKNLWSEISQHTLRMSEKMGRSVSFRVALLDYILVHNRVIKNPKIIELNLFDSVVKNSVVDELTNIYNRRYFNLAIKREIKRAKRYERPLCLFVFDVDNFKLFNDTFGHSVGDQVLRLIGVTLKDSFRLEDTICRVGGEEFAILLPEVDTESALIASNRFCEKLRTNSMERLQNIITISGGISEFPLNGLSAEELYENADAALYKVKSSGKNNVLGFSNS